MATVSRNARLEETLGYKSLSDAFAHHPEINAVVLCTPPGVHYAQACEALRAGRHVFLEKPPTASLAELASLKRLAKKTGLTLYTSWHSRFAAAVAPAREWLANGKIQSVVINWRENVRKWHPGQDWIFEPGGMGVFDPGINALSIATQILPWDFKLQDASLTVPKNRQAPIAASLRYAGEDGVPVVAEFDFRENNSEVWEITVVTDQGEMKLSAGGAKMSINGDACLVDSTRSEYEGLYSRFAELVKERTSEIDATPLVHVADAFLMGKRIVTDDFDW